MSAPLILVAEDDPSVRMTLEVLLGLEGFEVLVAEDGVRAVNLAQARLPDVILLDQVMPGMDGREVLAVLRGNEPTSKIPVLLLTGMDRRFLEEWPDVEFVGKPFDPDDLVARIQAVIQTP